MEYLEMSTISKQRSFDVSFNALSSYLVDARFQYKRAKLDLREANQCGVREWKAAAMRRLNTSRAELRRAIRLTHSVLETQPLNF
jgi:hypothetical protein